MSARFVRLGEENRPELTIHVDGVPITAKEGDTLMVAILAAHDSLRTSEFDETRRAGFCLMGACQDCWVWTEEGDRLRSCSTPVSEGLKIITGHKDVKWADVE
jgi:predicted molibdopterin-dependent oxidoreductase YjgC